ncbi:hypothetical protein [Xanthobacter versatilis]|uniref:hypothetical protein n=1 Tax=Xanthobacter autotrophicus (strain ATCC BAA-1158 / Py2) TaxID=78245 RepID=UPI00372CB654
MTDLAQPGHNNPPEPTPYELSKQEIDDLCMEARNWLDGEPVSRSEVAKQIDDLKVMIRAAVKEAKDRRDTETKPLNDALKEIHARYNALVGDTKTTGKGIAILAMEECDKVLAPWLKKLSDEKEAAAKKAREESDAKAKAAQDAIRAASTADLATKEEAEALLRDAKKAEAAVKKIERAPTGMASHLRRSWHPVLIDATEAARWAWKEKRSEMEAFLQGLAEREVRAGHRSVPGFEVVEEKGVA